MKKSVKKIGKKKYKKGTKRKKYGAIKKKELNLDNNYKIIHIPIQFPELEKGKKFIEDKLLTYNPTLSIPKGIQSETTSKAFIIDYKKSKDNQRVKYNLDQFNNEWPSNTHIHCWWCCHSFNNQPIGLPIKYNNKVFEVYGCFCSVECSAAYNFNTYFRRDQCLERYSLINLLYNITHTTKHKKVTSAPPRETLNIFGGHLTIDEFRRTDKQYKIIVPPMVSIIPIQEESSIINRQTDFIPLDGNKLNQASKNLRLQRTKPIIKPSNTLEGCMNLKYNSL